MTGTAVQVAPPRGILCPPNPIRNVVPVPGTLSSASVSSIAALRSPGGAAAYAVSKAAMISLLQSTGASAGAATAADLVWRAASYVPQIIVGIIALVLWFRKANRAFATAK